MSAAIFGLIGVVIGAILTGGVEFGLRRVEQRRELRRVRRLIGSELSTVWTHLLLIVQVGGGALPPRVVEEKPDDWLPTQAWRLYKEALAGSLVSDAEWRELDSIYDDLIAMRYGLFAGGNYPTLDLERSRTRIENVLIGL